jgi:hypothetical protein
MCDHCTRREFLGKTMLGSLLLTTSQTFGNIQTSPPSTMLPSKVRICAMFAGDPVPHDRGWGVSEQEIAQMTTHLAAVEKKLGNVEFVIGRANSAQAASALMQRAGPDAPVLAVNLSIGGLLRVAPPILESKRPLAVFSAPASGHDWMYPFRWRKEGHPVTLMTSSDYTELERAATVLRTVPLMRHSRILVFEPLRGTAAACAPDKVKSRLGVDLVLVQQQRFDEMLEQVDAGAAQKETEEWISGAEKIVEPSRNDVQKAAKVSVALQRLLQEEKAQGLAVGTCMGWLARGFPCLGFTKLRDIGIPSSCEGDMDSLLTMLLFQHAFGIPGFQGNATFDTSRNALWTAHCVGPLKMDGPSGPSAPYLLRSHSEIGDGVVPEIRYRIGQKITRTKLVNLDSLLISTGTICEVPKQSIRACRTQIVTEVTDAAKMVRNWGGGVLEGDMMTLLHRVVFYGDLLQSTRALADVMNIRVIEEG